MTRAPLSTEGHASTWEWQWLCDQDGCGAHTPPVHRDALPTPGQLQASGWFIAKLWGDRCPACRTASQGS